MKLHIGILLPIFILLAIHARSQNYIANYQRYSVEDGLSYRKVNCIIQDKEGFIWVGTSQGLNRFDGHTFKYWTKTDNGFPFENITDLIQDGEGLLWVFSSDIKGIAKIVVFNPTTGEVVPFEKKFGKQFQLKAESYVMGHAEEEDGTVYLGTYNPAGYIKYNSKTGFQQVIISKKGAFAPRLATGGHTIWGRYTPMEVVNFDSLHTVECDTKGGILHDLGRCIIKGDRYSADGGFYYENFDRQTFRYAPENPSLKEVLPEVARTKRFQLCPLWTYLHHGKVMASGIQIVELATGKVILDLMKPMPEFETAGVGAWLVDRNGGLWIGYDFGLVKIEVRPSKFQSLMFNGDNHKLGIAVRGIFKLNDDRLLVNTEFKGQWKVIKSTGVAEQDPWLPSEFYYGSGIDNQGNIYNLTAMGGLEQVSPTGVKKQSREFPHDMGWHFYNDGEWIWICTQLMGVYLLEPTSPTILPFGPLHGFDDFNKTIVYYIGKDAGGVLWACTGNGFYKISFKEGVLERYWSGGEGKFHLPADYFVHFYCDKDGVFWLATLGGGLIRWDKDKTGEVKQFGRKSGFPSQTIYAIYEDDHGHLWMPSDFGVIQFDKAQQQVRRVYGTNEGITHQEFNRISHFRDSDGTLYFGGLNGITVFNPNNFYSEAASQNPPLVISECLKYNTRLGKMDTVTNEVKSSKTITLKANESYCSIELALLTFEESSKIQYAYRFGTEEKWTILPGRTLYLGGLPFGKQKLYIKAQAANGVWSDKQLELTVFQMKPYYLQTWFLSLLAALVLGGFWGFSRWRTWQFQSRQKMLEKEIGHATAHIAQQAEELRRLDEVKSRFFANVSHELRTPLTLMLGPIGSAIKSDDLNKRNLSLLQLAQMHGKSLLRLVNQILDLSKLDSDKLELHEAPVLLEPLLSRFIAAFESHAERVGIHFLFQNKTEKTLQLSLDAPKLETIINNLLSNALKFTPKGGRVTVTVEDLGHSIRISVNDTGRGVHPADLPYIFDRFYQTKQPGAAVEGGTGIGLALCRELAELMKGKIWAESPGVGSTFFLEIPKKLIIENGELRMDDEELRIENGELRMEEVETEVGGELSIVNSQLSINNEFSIFNFQFSILIVEDNYSLRDYLVLILSPKYRVFAAENGQAALDFLGGLAGGKLPDLIMTDVMMPVMDGFQLLEKIKGDDRYRHLPMVMLTARADTQDKLNALRIGVDDYLVKPFEEEELLTRLDNLLLNYQVRRAANMEMMEENLLGSEGEVEAKTVEVAEAALSMNAEEQQWLEQYEQVVKKKLGDTNLTAEVLADAMIMSRSTLYRQVKRLTGLTPVQYIEEARFQFARQKFESGESRSVKATAYQAGFLHVGNFSRLYHKRFGKYPSDER